MRNIGFRFRPFSFLLYRTHGQHLLRAKFPIGIVYFSLTSRMENSHDPQLWSLREWLAFMLIAAASADGSRSRTEMRYLRVEVGNDAVDKMLALEDVCSPEERDTILREALPIFLKRQGAREKLQRIMRDVFMTDGEYGTEEQALTKKIGDWIRAASIS